MTESQLQEVHARVMAACERTVARDGVSSREAFERHLRLLFAEYRPIAVAYAGWLLVD